VRGFTNIIGVSFGVKWDSTVLRFDSVGNFGLRLNKLDHFGLSQAKSGQMRFLWQEGIIGVNLRDNATLFSIHFSVIGKPNSRTSVVFDTIKTFPPLIPEITDANSNLVNTVYQNGSIFVKSTGTSSLFSNQPENIRINKAYPNPFTDQLTLEFNLRQAENVSIEVLDLFGRVVHQVQRRFFAGKQEMVLPQSVFPTPGTYFVRLSQGDSFTMQQIIFMAR
jgi:Secretion system C-terminal sorting domain